MCGIVGYVGEKECSTLLINALKKLEYRGYDSSGIAVINSENKLNIHKEKGKIANMEASLPKNFKGNLGIAHTRWATHGIASKINAHPHSDKKHKIALVHNGIIENYKSLKTELEKKGYVFVSETDSEVLANLISYLLDKTHDLKTAVQSALQLVEGAYGIAVIHEDEPDKVIVARCGSPLIIGLGTKENFIASDIVAILIHTSNIIYLEDKQLATITKDKVEIYSIDNNEEIKAEIQKINMEIANVEKGDYPHYMLKEIFEQSQTIKNAFNGRIDKEYSTIKLSGLNLPPKEIKKIKNIHIIACGTSWHSALIGKYIIEKMSRISVNVEYASEFRYRNFVIPEDSVFFFISQSGETADTFEALKEVKKTGEKVFAITNVVSSSIARNADGGIYLHAGHEIGVASTKAFTSQIIVLALIGMYFGNVKGTTNDYYDIFVEALEKLPSQIEEVLKLDDKIKKIAYKIQNFKNVLYLGRNVNFPVALEGALKLKEISYIHAEGYPTAEMKHGPLALIDENFPVIALVPKGKLYPKTFSNLQEIKARNGKIFAIASEIDPDLEAICEDVLYIPHTTSSLLPILTVIPLQLIAYYTALYKGKNIDQPRNLAKSVTVE